MTPRTSPFGQSPKTSCAKRVRLDGQFPPSSQTVLSDDRYVSSSAHSTDRSSAAPTRSASTPSPSAAPPHAPSAPARRAGPPRNPQATASTVPAEPSPPSASAPRTPPDASPENAASSTAPPAAPRASPPLIQCGRQVTHHPRRVETPPLRLRLRPHPSQPLHQPLPIRLVPQCRHRSLRTKILPAPPL